MREIALFVEDFGHRSVVEALIVRLAREVGIRTKRDWRTARRGHPEVIHELKQYLRDLAREKPIVPDLVVVATDANCKGLSERTRVIDEVTSKIAMPIRIIVPDPHVERWLLLDSGAFKTVFGRGCDAPDLKCERHRYKNALIESIRAAGVTPSLGGFEFAADIIEAMDLDAVAGRDPSFGRAVSDLRTMFRSWKA